MKKVMIVEDNTFVQTYLCNMIEAAPDYAVTGIFSDAFKAADAFRQTPADLVLMDVQTQHNHSGLAAAKKIKESSKDAKVIIVTSLVDPDVLAEARNGCADSLWYKDSGEADLMKVIEDTLAGKHIFPDTSPDVELRKDVFSSEITPRQLEILRCFVKGMMYDEIAEKLGITNSGVRWNLDQIVEKCGFENKHELMAAAIDSKLIVTYLKDDEQDG
ncbi:MAG: response regulator transcription factor [Anaerovoracaceae bacterium]|jgi:DNA-binding NarL/FixJ family response regulator